MNLILNCCRHCVGAAVGIAVLLLILCIPTVAAAQQPRWEEIGPYTVGGRVSAVAVDPSDPAHWIVGTPGGGVWQTNDAGATWTPLTLWLSTVPISTIAIDPSNNRRILLGTGTLDDSGAVGGGIGVVGTSDAGTTWVLDNASTSGAFVSEILIWPGEPQRVIVCTDLGIRISTDGGSSYTNVLDGQALSSIVRDPYHPDVVFASARTGLWRSDDRGSSWIPLAPWPLLATDEFGAGTTALAISARRPGLLYATVQVLGTFNHTSRALVLRSTDGGQTFTSRVAPEGFCPRPETCGFAHAIAVDPTDDDRVLLAGERLSRSVDGGLTWNEVEGVTGVHEVARTSALTLAVGRIGVTALDNAWNTAERRNHNLAIAAVGSLDLSNESSPRLLASTGDSGTLLLSAPSPWRVIFAPDEPAGPARFDPFDSERIMASRRFGELFRSDDSGVTFSPVQAGLDLSQPAATAAQITPSPLEPDVWYTGRLQMFSTTSGGAAWAPFRPPGFPEVGVIETSPVVAGRVYFGTQLGGALYKTDPTTTETEQLVVADDPNLRIASLFLDPDAQNVMYAAGVNTTDQGGRVFKSSNFGVSWTNVTPATLAPASSVLKDRFGALYVGTRDGVWRSGNDGYSWTRYTNGLFAGGVTALKAGGGWMYAGTSGRGVFRVRELPLISIESTPPGVRFLIDGSEQQGPYVAHWEPGSIHSVAPVAQNNAFVREEFLGWADGGPADRLVTTSDTSHWLMAGFKRSFRLGGAAVPSGAGTIEFAPLSDGGFYPERSFVRIIPVPAPDHRVLNFHGDLSGNDGLIAYAFMDRPRSVAVTFEPLRMTIKSDPPHVTVTVDGENALTPTTYQWADGSSRIVSAPELLGTSVYDPVMAFDSWTDLRPRTHALSVTRDTFMTDLTARYISTVRGVMVPAGGTRTLTSIGAADAPRMAGLRLSPDGDGGLPAVLQLVRGSVGGFTVQELVLTPSAPRAWTSLYVEQDVDGPAGRIRIALFNPGATEARVGILLRAANGSVQAATLEALKVGAGAHATAWLDELMQLPSTFTSLLTLIASEPLVTTVHSVRGNWRPTHVLDPALLAPFVPGDYGVAVDPRVQVVLRTPDTAHKLVVLNAGFSRLSGILAFHDETGAPAVLDLSTGTGTSTTYDLAPGGFLVVSFSTPAGAAGSTVQARVSPAAGQPAPSLQMTDERHLGSINGSPTILPRSVPPSVAARSFRVPINRALRDTGVVLTNTSPLPATCTIRVIDREGVVIDRSTTIVPAGFQNSVDGVSEALPADFAGQLTIDTDIPVHGVGYLRLANARGEEIVAGFPAVTDEAPQPLASLALDGDSWRSEWWFMNTSGVTTRTRLDFRGHNGVGVYFPVQ